MGLYMSRRRSSSSNSPFGLVHHQRKHGINFQCRHQGTSNGRHPPSRLGLSCPRHGDIHELFTCQDSQPGCCGGSLNSLMQPRLPKTQPRGTRPQNLTNNHFPRLNLEARSHGPDASGARCKADSFSQLPAALKGMLAIAGPAFSNASFKSPMACHGSRGWQQSISFNMEFSHHSLACVLMGAACVQLILQGT